MGLTLVQTKPAPDQRTLMQLAYRVGRQGESCRRVRCKGMPAVDQEKDLQYRKKLHAFLRSIEALADPDHKKHDKTRLVNKAPSIGPMTMTQNTEEQQEKWKNEEMICQKPGAAKK